MNHTLSLRARKKLESLWRKATRWQYFCSDDQLVNWSHDHMVSWFSQAIRQSKAPQLFSTIWHGGWQVTGRETVVASLTTTIPSVGNLLTSPPGSWSLPPRSFQQLPPLPVAPSFVPQPLTWVCCPGGAGGLPPTSLSCSLSQRATGLEDPRLRGLRDQPTNPPTAGKVSTQRKIHSQLEYSTLRKILLNSRDLGPQGIFLGLKKLLTWEKATGGGLIFQQEVKISLRLRK